MREVLDIGASIVEAEVAHQVGVRIDRNEEPAPSLQFPLRNGFVPDPHIVDLCRIGPPACSGTNRDLAVAALWHDVRSVPGFRQIKDVCSAVDIQHELP